MLVNTTDSCSKGGVKVRIFLIYEKKLFKIFQADRTQELLNSISIAEEDKETHIGFERRKTAKLIEVGSESIHEKKLYYL